MGERSGSVLSYITQPRTPTLLDMLDLMDEDEGLEEEGSKETGELAEDPVPESAPLSEVREVRHWADDPVPIVHSFLVCRSVPFDQMTEHWGQGSVHPPGTL